MAKRARSHANSVNGVKVSRHFCVLSGTGCERACSVFVVTDTWVARWGMVVRITVQGTGVVGLNCVLRPRYKWWCIYGCVVAACPALGLIGVLPAQSRPVGGSARDG